MFFIIWKKYRKFVFSLLIIFLFIIIVACNGKDKNENITDDSGVVTSEETTDEIDYRLSIPDDLPDINFEGAKFRISTKAGFLYEVYTEEEDGEILNDALYERNRKIEERFNIEIVPVITQASDGATQVNYVQTTILSGSDEFELAATYVFTSGTLVTNKLYYNWLKVGYNNFDKPWWINGINENFRIGDAVYTVVGDMSLSALRLTYAMFFNKRLATDYDIPNLYQTIYDNKWTIDYFIALTRDIYSDLNGDGIADDHDLYGFAAEAATNLDVYPFAFGIPLIKQNSDGIPELSANTQRMITAIDKVIELYWKSTGSHIPTPGREYGMFREGLAVFATTWLSQTMGIFRDMEDDYGILPYPKYDERQEKYMTGAMDNYSVLGIPVTVPDPTFASIITEALNAESHKILFPVYYETALKVKYARDEDSIAMLDLVMNGRNFDMSTLFGGQVGDITWIFRTQVASKQNDFVSKYASVEERVKTALDKIIQVYIEDYK